MTQPFRALLLAAGLGTRLRPITLNTPKCLVPIGGEPLLGRWLRMLEMAGCDSVLINTHYLADQVEAFLMNWSSSTMTCKLLMSLSYWAPLALCWPASFSREQQACSFMPTTPRRRHRRFWRPTASAGLLPTDHADLQHRPRVAAESSSLTTTKLFKPSRN